MTTRKQGITVGRSKFATAETTMANAPDPEKTLTENFASLHDRLNHIDTTLKTLVKDVDFKAAIKQILDRLPPRP